MLHNDPAYVQFLKTHLDKTSSVSSEYLASMAWHPGGTKLPLIQTSNWSGHCPGTCYGNGPNLLVVFGVCWADHCLVGFSFVPTPPKKVVLHQCIGGLLLLN